MAGHVLAEVGGYFCSGGIVRYKDGAVCHPENAAAKELGIGPGVATDLFDEFPHALLDEPMRATAADAAACLRRLAATGEVLWEDEDEGFS